jgi:hypothetical protein
VAAEKAHPFREVDGHETFRVRKGLSRKGQVLSALNEPWPAGASRQGLPFPKLLGPSSAQAGVSGDKPRKPTEAGLLISNNASELRFQPCVFFLKRIDCAL